MDNLSENFNDYSSLADFIAGLNLRPEERFDPYELESVYSVDSEDDEFKTISVFRQDEEDNCNFDQAKEVAVAILTAGENLGVFSQSMVDKVIEEFDDQKPIFEQISTNVETSDSPQPPNHLENYLSACKIFLESNHSISKAIDIINTPLVRESKIFQAILDYDDTTSTVKISDLDKFKIVYCPSGGGKTSFIKSQLSNQWFSSNEKELKLYDVDEFTRDNWSSFCEVLLICRKIDDFSYILKWFKFTLFKKCKSLSDKILFLNDPIQIPNCFRLGSNELIIIPKQTRYGVKFFDNNYFSLQAVRNKTRLFLNYDEYESGIKDHFNLTVRARPNPRTPLNVPN